MNNSYAALEAFFGQTAIQMTGFRRDLNLRPYARQRSELTTTPPRLPFKHNNHKNMYISMMVMS
jgi:hypothetical protein